MEVFDKGAQKGQRVWTDTRCLARQKRRHTSAFYNIGTQASRPSWRTEYANTWAESLEEHLAGQIPLMEGASEEQRVHKDLYNQGWIAGTDGAYGLDDDLAYQTNDLGKVDRSLPELGKRGRGFIGMPNGASGITAPWNFKKEAFTGVDGRYYPRGVKDVTKRKNQEMRILSKAEQCPATPCRMFFDKKGICRWGDECGYKHTEDAATDSDEEKVWQTYDPDHWDPAESYDDPYLNFQDNHGSSSSSKHPRAQVAPAWKELRNRKRGSGT